MFAYGSLVEDLSGRPARLEGHRRAWGVAMDNANTVAGYKSYRLRSDGSRPAVHVAFLDIAAEPGALTHGTLIAVDDEALRALDARERNYERIEVTAHVPAAPGTVWAYRGSAAGRERLRVGLERGSAVVAADYAAAIAATFAVLGIDDPLERGPLALMDLERVDVEAPGDRAT